jgi:hypothetical protein
MAVQAAYAIGKGLFSIGQGIFGAKKVRKRGQKQARLALEQAEYNAKIKQAEAKGLSQFATQRLLREGEATRRIMADQEGSIVKSGAMLGEGTPLNLRTKQFLNRQTDVTNQYMNDRFAVQRARNEAKMIQYQGQERANAIMAQADSESRSTLLSGITSGAGSLMSGIKSFIPKKPPLPYGDSMRTAPTIKDAPMSQIQSPFNINQALNQTSNSIYGGSMLSTTKGFAYTPYPSPFKISQ